MIKQLLIFFLIIPATLTAQVKLNTPHHNFGEITAGSDRFFDFELTNKTGKKFFVLRIDADRDISSLISQKTVQPDSTTIIRIQYNPKEAGKFSKQIGVYISSQNDPVMLSVSGEVKSLPTLSNDLACPDFNRVSPGSLTPEFPLLIGVVDHLTGEPVNHAEVKIVHLGIPRYKLLTNSSGKIQQQIPIGYYYFVVGADGYEGNEFDAYVNVRNSRIIVELMPAKLAPIDPEPLDSLFYAEYPVPPVKDPGRADEWIGRDSLKPAETIVNNEPPKDTIIPQPSVVDDDGTFREDLYLKNNIVFLIDISGSMMTDGKMELLKSSMIELARMLRPVDKISIVVYASNAHVVMESVPGDHKEVVIEKIQQMEGGGYTAGAEGMKMAYDLALRNLVPGGNNMVIMATDGAFNLYTTDVTPMVKRYKKKGINTSVVGIKNTERDAASMKTIAGLGAGRYVPINNFEEALSSLTEEIKKASRK